MTASWIHATERYRYATRGDLASLAALLSDAEVGRWLWFAPLTPEGVEAYFGPLLDRQGRELEKRETPLTAVFVVEDSTPEFLGMGAVVAVEGSPRGFEIGFQLARVAWGRGVGTRLGHFLCAYAIERCNAYRIEASCLEGNEHSAAILRKLGLHLEATRPGYRLQQDTRHTELCFGREVHELDTTAIDAVARLTGLL